MAQNDYIVDIGKSEVSFKGTPVARFDSDTHKVKEYLADGGNRKRWIAASIKAAPQYKAEEQFDYDAEGSWETVEAITLHEEEFYKYFAAAPKPYNNKVGFKHMEVYEWMKANHPKVTEHMYPDGPFNELEAGLASNRTIRPIQDVEIEYLN